jgi:hypothetical protein
VVAWSTPPNLSKTVPTSGSLAKPGTSGALRDGEGRPMTFMRRLAAPDAEQSEGAPHVLGPQLILQTAWDGATDLGLRKEASTPPGGRLSVTYDPLLGRALHTTWFSWTTEWDDGSLENS